MSSPFCIRLVIVTSGDIDGIHILNKIKLSEELRGDVALNHSGYCHLGNDGQVLQ